MDDDPGPDEGPTRWQRALVLGALGLLLVGGVAEVEAWPMTAWRLFSDSRRAEQSGWSLQVVEATGEVASVSLGDLPLGYRLAGWPLGEAARSSSGQADELCAALLEEVRVDHPDGAGLRVLRTRRRLVERGGSWWSVEVATEVVARCGAGEER